MGKQNAPYVVRWRNGVMDDTNPALTWRALVAAMALTRYADVKTGHNCYPGATKCARNMRVSEDTIRRGWAELVEAGWLEIRSRGEGSTGRASIKLLRWPARNEPTADGDNPLTAVGEEATTRHQRGVPPADSGTTFPGTGEPSGLEAPRVTDEGGVVESGRPGNRGGSPKGWTPCAQKGCAEAATVENFGASWCERHAAEEYDRNFGRGR
jgi:hypothetical protein